VNWQIAAFDEIDSTNAYVAKAARDGANEGLVARADFQLAGKGRGDRTWESPAGSSLMFSVLLRPSVPEGSMQLIVAAVALSVREAVSRATGVVPALKWPNDILLNDHKVAGILSEAVKTPAGLTVVVGVGLNLTAHPPIVGASDVAAETGVTLDAASLLDAVLEDLAFRYEQTATPEGRTQLGAAYRAGLDTIGRRVRIETLGGTVHGLATGVDETGALELEVDGETQRFQVGDIVHLRREDDA